MPDSGGDVRATRPEPAFNAPWPVLALIVVLIGAHAMRTSLGVDVDRFALSSDDLRAGRWGGLVTHLFVHASWPHVLLNSIFILAFGTPVARFLGTGARGALAFAGFFLACGVLAGAGFAGMAAGLARLGFGPADWGVVGASGAVSGLMGAAARLIEGRGRVGRLGGRTVVGMTVAWIVANAVFGLTGLAPGTEGAPVAWQAHIMGYFAGMLLISGAGRVAGVHAEMRR